MPVSLCFSRICRSGVAFGLLLLCLSAAPAASARAPAEDTLGATLAGEFALQAGKLDQAARWYLEAARAAEGDAGLAERAARIALLADDEASAAAAVRLWRQRAPQSLALRAAEVTLALRRNDERGARRGLEALLRSRDAGGDGWRYALAALGGSGQHPQLAARLLGQLLDADLIPNQLQAWLAFGGLAQRLDQEALAARIVAAVIARFPGEPRVALLHASQLRESGNLEDARRILAGLEAATDDNPDLRLSVAAEYDALGDPGAAAAVLARGPQDDRSYGLRAALLARADDKAGLGRLYEALQRDAASPDPQRRLLLGQVAEFLGRQAQALEWYRSVPGGGERWQARLRAANVLHALARADEAYAELRRLQAEAAADEDARRDAYLLEAELRRQDQDDRGELEAYARGLAAFADDAALLYARGLAWERRDDIPRAEADFRRILVAEPDNIATLNALGYTLADRTTRYTEALELIDRARVAEPDNPAIIDSYGWVLYRLGRHEEALVQLRRAFALQKDPEIAAHLGEVLWVGGQKDEARRYFEEGRKLDPDNRALKRALARTGA
ncbi:tetratricopeptide repeat protein [Cognatiluteimonas weifangensis]|uniref:Tetratricopeptide repeat protein n=1 Tax=Cognatiluteimonas weifangensis TaxID=2303539 RepID=A0A372DIH3_9GAMM|nr:tetratricopeptide repeat protein [Luteimonas weifangensis]RFP59343.1 tetratricopeptide repeat protein [Luteimonas weifangensis]